MDVADIEVQSDLVDARFKNPIVNNHIRRIKESITQVHLSLASMVKSLDYEHSKYDHATQMHRVFKYFSTMDTAQMSDMMDAFETFDKEHPPTEFIAEQLNK